MFLGEVGAVAATTGRALKHMKGASLASAIFEFESGVSAVRIVPLWVVLHRSPCIETALHHTSATMIIALA